MALTPAQIKAGYSTIPGPYNPLTGELKVAPVVTTPPAVNNPENNTTTTDNSASLLKSIQDSLLQTSGIISSQGNQSDAVFKSAIDTINNNKDSSNTKLQSEFERNANYLGESANADMMNGRAAGGGGIMNLGAYKALVDSTDKSLKDLAQRKEELVLQNNVEAASKVSELELQALKFKQDASQQFFSNLLGIGSFSLNLKNNQDASTKAMTTLIQDNPQAGIMASDSMEEAQSKIAANPNSPDVLYKKAQTDNIRSEILHRNDAPAGTAADRLANNLAGFASYFQVGSTYTLNGTKRQVLDSNHFIEPEAWKQAINSAPSKGVTRKQFIQQFGYLLSPYAEGSKDNTSGYSKYGLTPQEITLITSGSN